MSEQPFRTTVQLTANDSDAVAYAPGVYFCVNCTVAGDVSVDMAGGGTVVFRFELGQSFLRLAVSRVNVTGTTATATYYNLNY